MIKAIAVLFLAGVGTTDASVASFLQSQKGKSRFNFAGFCRAMSKSIQGYSWDSSSSGGLSTMTIKVTCSGKKLKVVCKKAEGTLTGCTSEAGGGSLSSGGGGCGCGSTYPYCSRNKWCYQSQDSNSYSRKCPGTCTKHYTAPAPPKCLCTSSYPYCSKNKWCYKGSNSYSYTQTCGGKCTGNGVASRPAKCTCPSSYPDCNSGNKWCYKSSTSNSYTQTCAAKCTGNGVSSSPRRRSSSSRRRRSSSGGSPVKAVHNSCGGFSQSEVQEMLDWHNKFRCAVGTPNLKWSGDLECQAQKTQNRIGAFSHSSSYKLPISSGENLATGSGVALAVWMWFTEYMQTGTRGHFTAMVWEATTEVGCGVQKGGGGVVRCQYAHSPPNYGGQYKKNVPAFYGTKAQFKKCGIDPSQVKSYAKKFKGWNILNPVYKYTKGIGGLFEIDEDVAIPGTSPTVSLLTLGAIGASIVAVLVSAAVVVKRWRRRASEPRNMMLVETELPDESASLE